MTTKLSSKVKVVKNQSHQLIIYLPNSQELSQVKLILVIPNSWMMGHQVQGRHSHYGKGKRTWCFSVQRHQGGIRLNSTLKVQCLVIEIWISCPLIWMEKKIILQIHSLHLKWWGKKQKRMKARNIFLRPMTFISKGTLKKIWMECHKC
jgi:hypothetical protein